MIWFHNYIFNMKRWYGFLSFDIVGNLSGLRAIKMISSSLYTLFNLAYLYHACSVHSSNDAFSWCRFRHSTSRSNLNILILENTSTISVMSAHLSSLIDILSSLVFISCSQFCYASVGQVSTTQFNRYFLDKVEDSTRVVKCCYNHH